MAKKHAAPSVGQDKRAHGHVHIGSGAPISNKPIRPVLRPKLKPELHMPEIAAGASLTQLCKRLMLPVSLVAMSELAVELEALCDHYLLFVTHRSSFSKV